MAMKIFHMLSPNVQSLRGRGIRVIDHNSIVIPSNFNGYWPSSETWLFTICRSKQLWFGKFDELIFTLNFLHFWNINTFTVCKRRQLSVSPLPSHHSWDCLLFCPHVMVLPCVLAFISVESGTPQSRNIVRQNVRVHGGKQLETAPPPPPMYVKRRKRINASVLLLGLKEQILKFDKTIAFVWIAYVI